MTPDPLSPGGAYCTAIPALPYTESPATPTLSVIHNGAVDEGFALTVTSPATGIFWAAGTVPDTYSTGDSVAVLATFSVSGLTTTVLVDLFLVGNPGVQIFFDSAAKRAAAYELLRA